MRTKTAARKEAVSQFAEKQHGVVATGELLELGLSRSCVKRWTAERRLFRVHRGVYAIGRSDLTVRGKWLAAVKACGPDAVLSHLSAAVLWDLLRYSGALIDVTTPRRSRRHGVRVHTAPVLDPSEWLEVDRIPVTSVARTLADCAAVMPTRKVVRLLEQAERLGLFDLPALRERPALAEALAQVTGEAPRVNSDWERDLLDWCDDIGVPRPEHSHVRRMHVGAKTEHGKEAGAKACPGTSSPDDAARRRFAALRAPSQMLIAAIAAR